MYSISHSERVQVHPLLVALVWVTFLGSLLAIQTPGALLCAAVGIAIASMLVRPSMRIVFGLLRNSWLLLLLTAVFHFWLTPHKSGVYITILNIPLDVRRLGVSTLFTARLMLILFGTLLAFHLVDPRNVAREFGRVMQKFRLIARFSANIELIVMLSLRFIPFVTSEYRRLQVVLKTRGYSSASGIRSKLVRLRRTLLPLILCSFRRADHVAVALLARGFEFGQIKSYRNPARLRATDLAVASLLILIFLFSASLGR